MMARIDRYALAALLPAALLPCRAAIGAEAAPTGKPGTFIELSGDYTIPIVLKGRTARLKVAADALKWPILNGSLADAADLRSGPFKGSGRTEEGDPFTLRSRVVRNQYGDRRKRQRALWADHDVFAGVDGVVGPTGIGYQVVRFRLRPTDAGEHVTTHPLRGVPLLGLVTASFSVEIAGERVDVDFNLDRHDTLVTASTGRLLAATFGGALSGEPVSYALFNSKVRPGRRLVLARPLLIDGRDAGDIAVRVRPGATSGIPDSSDVPDPDEVVVTGGRTRKPHYAITLGTGYLQRCSSLTYDLRAKTVALSCR